MPVQDRYRVPWSHDETVLALGLYFRIPFGKVNKAHPQVVELARLMGRSPASLSMKIGNIGRLDPRLARQGISGLVNGAQMEQVVWDEYSGCRERLESEYVRLYNEMKSRI